MATTLSPTRRPREPVARRAFRHPPGTGHEIALRVERELAGEDEEPPRWWVEIEEAPGAPAWMPKLRYVMCGTRAQARRDFTERQWALRAAGYERTG
jgi:hypothetical protein